MCVCVCVFVVDGWFELDNLKIKKNTLTKMINNLQSFLIIFKQEKFI